MVASWLARGVGVAVVSRGVQVKVLLVCQTRGEGTETVQLAPGVHCNVAGV